MNTHEQFIEAIKYVKDYLEDLCGGCAEWYVDSCHIKERKMIGLVANLLGAILREAENGNVLFAEKK